MLNLCLLQYMQNICVTDSVNVFIVIMWLQEFFISIQKLTETYSGPDPDIFGLTFTEEVSRSLIRFLCLGYFLYT